MNTITTDNELALLCSSWALGMEALQGGKVTANQFVPYMCPADAALINTAYSKPYFLLPELDARVAGLIATHKCNNVPQEVARDWLNTPQLITSTELRGLIQQLVLVTD